MPEQDCSGIFLFVAIHDAAPMIFAFGLLETQNAPIRIALTKTNAAHAASTLSFIAIPTRHTSITVPTG